MSIMINVSSVDITLMYYNLYIFINSITENLNFMKNSKKQLMDISNTHHASSKTNSRSRGPLKCPEHLEKYRRLG